MLLMLPLPNPDLLPNNRADQTGDTQTHTSLLGMRAAFTRERRVRADHQCSSGSTSAGWGMPITQNVKTPLATITVMELGP